MASISYIKSAPSVYTPTQVVQWLKAIGYPETVGSSPDELATQLDEKKFPTTLETLTLVSRLHLMAFPFENLDMHYSPKHQLDVTAEGNFRRMVVERKGSYCYGKNGLLLEMLRGLGYRTYAGQGRVNGLMMTDAPPKYSTIQHMVLFVQPSEGDKTTYLVDAGFGGGGLVRPILLAEDAVVLGTTPTEKHRLKRGPHPESVLGKLKPPSSSIELSITPSTIEDPAALSWRLEVQRDRKDPSAPPAPWRALFTFSETEYFQSDFELSSFYVSTHPDGSPFLQNVLCVKYFYVDDRKEDLGLMFLYRDEVKQHTGTTSQEVAKIKTEEERIQKIREFYGIDIDDAAIEHIRGRPGELKDA
ncbi:hypothetical protein V5O48_013873 [Marasmius crinis-equi]|uniref:Arylamine N-acetyltransferase n=1 Tax=Marasmius crinis-equi TaxID=585013 RepID=A0ABR3EYY9_9AGAR